MLIMALFVMLKITNTYVGHFLSYKIISTFQVHQSYCGINLFYFAFHGLFFLEVFIEV